MLALAELSHEILRYVVMLVTMPLWLPFLKELWKELNRALRWEGGLLGKPPTDREREELAQRTLEEEDPLVHERLAGAGDRRGGFRSPKPGSARPGGASRRPTAAGRRPGQVPGAGPRRPSGFR